MTGLSSPEPLAADVGIVGGGPAGAWSAYRLARAGARVLLFDHSHPREKPCGGGVTGRAYTRVAPALAGHHVPFVPIEAVRFESGDGPAVRVPLSLSPTALIVTSRRDFDGALLKAAEQAGAVLVRQRVLDVAAGGRDMMLSTSATTYRVDWVIGADGANSLVRRRLAAPFRRSQLSITAGYFVHGPSSREIAIRFTSEPPGYLWSFPRADHLAVGACAPATTARPQDLRAIVNAWRRPANGGTSHRLEPYAWPIPTLSAADWDSDPSAAGPRWMLVGDAAGLVDPITREGIFFAIESGDLAASALLEGRPRPAETYVGALQDTLCRELRLAARLNPRFFTEPATRLLLEALRSSEAVRNLMADTVAGLQPYRSLTRRLLTTCQIGLAWRLFWLALTR